MMLILFGVDTISVIVNAIILKKYTDVNLLREFCLILKRYWLFMAIKFGSSMFVNYASRDINFGMDSTGEFGWITKEGRIQLILNSTDLSEEEKSLLLWE